MHQLVINSFLNTHPRRQVIVIQARFVENNYILQLQSEKNLKLQKNHKNIRQRILKELPVLPLSREQTQQYS